MADERTTHFLNVDLEVRSRASLAALVARLEGRVVVLSSERLRGVHLARFETLGARTATPDRCIAALVRLVEDLPRPERRLWDGASERVFDIGIQAGRDGQVFRPKIAASTLARVAALGAGIRVTVYPFGWGESASE